MKKFSFKNRYGLEIAGKVLIPETSQGLVFLLHGLGGFKEQPHIKRLEEVFYNNNYTVINFDATNSFGESEGKYEEATLGKHYEDLVDVINWSKKQSWYKEYFVLAGHSMGGYAVARYAEDFPDQVKAVFPWAAVISGELSFKKYQDYKPDELNLWKETGWKEEESKSLPGVIKRLPYSHLKERFNHNLLSDAQNLKMPVLIVVGENDTSCPPEHQKFFWDLIPKNTNNEFWIIDGAPHTFRELKHLKELERILANWLKKIIL